MLRWLKTVVVGDEGQAQFMRRMGDREGGRGRVVDEVSKLQHRR
jgi:hypothetical protein